MNEVPLRDKVKNILTSQRLGVLATQSDAKPHSSLIAIAETDELRHLVFTTSRETSKYRNLKAHPMVSVLVDNRSNSEADFHEALAVRVEGEAREIEHEDQRARMAAVYLEKHPHLAHFLDQPETALIMVAVADYVVSSFGKTQVLLVG